MVADPSAIPESERSWDTADAWVASPVLSFERWIIERPFLRSTRTVYTAMWRKFVHWLQAEGISLDEVGVDHIGRFLNYELPNKRRTLCQSLAEAESDRRERKAHRQRYVKLIERIYDHLIEDLALNLPGKNPGRQAGQARLGAGKNAPSEFLSIGEIQCLIGYIQAYLVRPIPDGPYRKGREWIKAWTAARDVGLVGVMIGAGVGVKEVGRLSVNCTIGRKLPAERLWVPGQPGTGNPGREALAFEVASLALERWKAWRAAVAELASSEVLFPADTQRRRHDLAVPADTMHPSTIFRRVSRVLAEAGIEGDRVGGQTLRNTYVAMLIEQGHSDHDIMGFMGLTPRSVFRLRDAVKSWGRGP